LPATGRANKEAAVAHRGRENADEALAAALACGATVEQAAAKAGVSGRTAYRRQKDPAFRRLVQAARGDIVQRAGGLLTGAALESIKTLLELQRPPSSPGVRLGAARSVLEFGLKVREAAELEGRLAELERRLDAQQGGHSVA
jgi:hypothetical protein